MASYFSHYLAAKAVIDQSPADGVIAKYADCFVLGAQGGDLLFYAFGKFRGYGARTHGEKTAELFSAALDYCRREKRPEPLAYTLGLLCHYALDSTVHPYVVSEARDRLAALYPENLKKCVHMMLETRIDCLMKKEAEEKGEICDLPSAIPVTKRSSDALADVWYNAINGVYGVDVPHDLLKKLPSRMYRYQKVFMKPRSLACAVLRFAAKKMNYPAYIVGFFLPDENDPDYDYLNLENRPYPEYVGAENTISFSYPRLFDEAVQKSLSLADTFTKLYEKGGEADASLFKINFSGSLSESGDNA